VTHLLPFAALTVCRQQIIYTPAVKGNNSGMSALTGIGRRPHPSLWKMLRRPTGWWPGEQGQGSFRDRRHFILLKGVL